MKRIFAVLFVILLSMMLGICVFASADESVLLPENATDTEKTSEASVIDETKFDKLLEGLTNSTFWITTLLILAAIVACVATFRKKFGFIITLAKTIISILKTVFPEQSAHVDLRLNEITNKVRESDENIKALTTLFTLFISNANINPNAKAEIMKYVTGIKDFSGNILDIVEESNRIIDEANDAEEKILTPTLDSIISEKKSETPMVLA